MRTRCRWLLGVFQSTNRLTCSLPRRIDEETLEALLAGSDDELTEADEHEDPGSDLEDLEGMSTLAKSKDNVGQS